MTSSGDRNPLVKGGVPRETRELPLTFATQTPFVMNEKTRIVAVVSADYHKADPLEDGWFISDFYAFMALYKGLGTSQTWLTAVKPRSLVNKYGDYLHGDPRAERKIVLSNRILDADDFKEPTVVASNRIAEEFIKAVSEASSSAMREDGNLLIMIFCHGTADHKLLLGNGRFGELTAAQLRGAIDHHLPVTLITTACYGGGWIMDPAFNFTTMLAADKGNCSLAWQNSDSIGRACGSVFASSVVEALASDTSSFDLPAGHGAPGSPASPGPQQSPHDALDADQVRTYNEFCGSIVEACQQTTTGSHHRFAFSAQDDEWEWPWTRRTAIPLEHYRDRWNQLETYRAPSSTSPTGLASSRGTLTSNKASGLHGEQKKGSISERHRLKEVVNLFRQWCPGTWSAGYEVSLRGCMRKCAERGDPNEIVDWVDGVPTTTPFNVYEVVRYRLEFARTVDRVIDSMGLAKPNGQPPLLWDYGAWLEKIVKENREKEWWEEQSWLADEFLRSDLFQRRNANQGPPFIHIASYLYATIFETNKPRPAMKALAAEIHRRMDSLRKAVTQQAMGNATVRQKRDTWKRSMRRCGVPGRRSPRKSTSSWKSIEGFWEQGPPDMVAGPSSHSPPDLKGKGKRRSSDPFGR